ncbi:amino acid adenylation domain-containing protein [Microcoleus sp. Pol11C3]|uniref:amino acid adenylation domain-containing protein n=1 Tax=Microcoleus sp. Pol11C3 TaxID=3055390 RepID=UPI002FD529AB
MTPETTASFHPLSLGQQALWFLYQMAPESVAYNIFDTAVIRSSIDITALHRVWQKIVNRHPILRTTYTNSEGKPFQILHEYLESDIQITDASNWSEDYLKKQILLETDRPFNLEKELPWRLNIFTLSPQEHILLLTMHHIVSDSWSYDLLFTEMQLWYAVETEQLSHQQIEASVPKNLPYTDFVHWQSEMLSSPKAEKHWEYWQKQLAGDLPILNLPTDRPRPPIQSFRGKTHIFQLDEKLIKGLGEVARATGTTLYKLMLAAFFVLLYRYTNQEDILVGSPMLGRSGREFRGVVGYFVNPAVLRASISPNLTFPDLLDQVSTQVKAAQKHQDYPFPLLVEQLQPQRDPSRSPLFQVSFTWQKQRWCESGKELGLKMEPYPLGHQRGASFDLDVMMMEMGEVLLAGWQYNTDLFDGATIARMVEHYQTLLEGIVTNPKQKILELPLLTPNERHQLLVEWNNTWAEYPQDKCIHQLFEEQVQRSPSSVAVVFEGEKLTYRELNARANQLAHYLRSLGVGPEVLVGICLERSFEMIIGLLGVLKAGGAYVALDPNYPSERLAFMLEDSSVPVLLTQEKLLEKLPAHSARVICLDSDSKEIASYPKENPLSSVKPENLAYVIYTSGSTGKPKGVLIQQGSLVNYTTAASAEYRIQKCDRILQFSSISFDVSAEEIYTSLTSGATLVLRTDSMLDSLEGFLQKCKNWEITVMALPTAYWHELTAFLTQETVLLPPSLRLIIIGGEKALPDRLKTWLECVEQRVRLVNNYGPTEATVGATIYDLSVVDTTLKELPIGRPLGNVCTYILDRNGQPVPIGVPGELLIGGAGLARGYLNRPDLTEEKFIPNPFSNEPGERLYKTGDLARYLPDGNIEYIGRIDNQVKIRGFRIELGEIETAISQHPSVQQTVVIATENKAGSKQLVAYILPQPEAAPKSNDLRNFLKQKLPDYMIPATFIMLETLPLTPNGKIDSKALPKPETVHQQLATNKVLPQTSTQKILGTIWAEVLQIQEVGIHDNFFELGGDSILSIQIIARCHQANLQLTPKDLFQHQTIAELAKIVTPTTEITAEQGLVTGHVALTPIQHWFVEENLPEPYHFNQSFLFEISPDLKPQLLQQVLQKLLLHHDALRLRLIPKGDTWQLLNSSTLDCEIFSITDISQIAPSEQITAIESTANQLQASLNLSEGPIIRVALFHLGEHQPNRLLIIIHHLAVDGVSWRILLEDLIAAYQQLNRGEKIKLPAKTTSFQDWAVRLTEYAQTQIAVAELDYWLTQLNSHTVPLPVDDPSQTAENQMADRAEVSVSLSAEQTTALLKEVPSAYNTQINDVLLTALAQSFALWTGQTSLLIDLEGHGREELFSDLDLARTVGWFTSVFPVLLKLEQAEVTAKSLKSIKEQLRHIPQRGIGYGIIRYLNEDETTRQQLQQLPQAQVSFNYLGQFDQMLSAFPILGLAQESSGSPVSFKGNRSHLLEIDGFVADGKLQLSWAYNTKIHQRATIERLANSFIETLTGIIHDCLSSEAFGYTPTDFPDADITQAELDELVESLTPKTLLESIYPLSPMQEGMLFHTLYAPNSGVYFEQLVCTLSENLNVSAFEQAWQRVVELHPILRTFFVWQNQQHPLQVVCKSVNLPYHIYDWRSLSSGEQEERLSAFLQAERERGFKLDKAPLMCCTLIQLADNNYQFVWSHHHLLMDGWCLPIVLKEVWAFYEAFNRGENLYLEAPPPYRNYIAWLRRQDLSDAQKFWRSQLAGFTAPTPLMVDKLVGNISEPKDIYDERKIKLSATLTDALKEFARQHHLTLNTLVQGAWALLLSRYSGESDVVFGATVSGRPPALLGVESMVGLFINTLPVRVQISAETELLSWLKQLQAQQVEREEYSYTPLVEIQGQSDVPKNQLLFNSIVVFENYPVDSSLLEGQGSVEIKNVVGFERTNYPLTVAVVPGGELSIQISYDTDRFDDDTVSRMLGHLESLLSGMVAQEGGLVGELPLLTQKEKQQLLLEWNNTWAEYPFDKCIHQLFEAQVERSPDAVAVVFEGEQLTYLELNARANQLAHYLRSLGVGLEVLVGICIERSLEMTIGILGILKAGGAYVPLDPGYPKERLAFILKDAAVPLLLTHSQLAEGLPAHSAQVVYLDKDWKNISKYNQENLTQDVKADNLAYVIYTSGSTGNPKGVCCNHTGVVNLLDDFQSRKPISIGDKCSLWTSINFDVSVYEIFTPLLSGGSLLIPSDFLKLNGEAFFGWLCTNQIRSAYIPPFMIEELVEWLNSLDAKLFLQRLLVGVEPIREQLLVEIVEKVPELLIINGYGPTEATVCVTLYSVYPRIQSYKNTPIGKPVQNTQTYILARHLQPVPIGVPGELHIAGVGLARGYLNRPDLTDEKFIPNPFSNEPGERLYKTGDLTRYLSDGNIEYLGRIDNQVKIRGFRIELGEIEAVLAKHPNVRSVTVIDREDTPGNKRLVAYLVSNLIPDRIPYHSECQLELNGNAITIHTQDISTGGVGLVGVPAIERGESVRVRMQLPGESEPRWLSGTVVWSRPPQAGIRFHLTPSEQAQVEQSVDYQLDTQDLWKTLQRTVTRNLRDYLKQKLPDYMIPSAFVLMKALPLTPNGKIDRRALPAPDNFHNEQEDKFVAPSTPTEAKLAAIWAEVLGLKRVGINDNFFELGGHSLLATRIISRIGQVFAIELPLRHLFEAPTIASLCKILETEYPTTLKELSDYSIASQNLSFLVPTTRKGHLPLSIQQEYIWHVQQLNPHSCSCNSGVALRLTFKVSSEALEKSINEIIRRHESLRTTFPVVDGQPVQVIAPELTLPLKIVDLQNIPSAKREAEALHFSEREINYHFDLANGPLIKATLVRLSSQEYWLLIPIHHIITDGWSIGIFVQELETLYNAFSNNLPSPLPELPLQYADFTLWQRQRFNEEVLAGQLNYWVQKLAAPLQQPEYQPDRESKLHPNSGYACSYSLVLNENLVTSLENLSRSQSITTSTILLAALTLLLFKYQGQSEIMIVTTIGNRSTPELETMLGCFINDVILRSQLNDEQTAVTLLEQVQEALNEAIANKEIPLQKVIEVVKRQRKLIFSASVTIVPPVEGSNQMPISELVLGSGKDTLWDEEIPLELYISSASEKSRIIEINAVYSRDLFTSETLERLFSYYQEILQNLASSPQMKIAEFEQFKKK